MKHKKLKSKEDKKADLQDLSAKAAQEDSAKEFMNPVRGRGRPKGAKNKPHDPVSGTSASGPTPISESEDLQQVKKYVKPVFEMISGVGVKIAEDNRAAFGPEEMEILVDSGANCINQYLPGLLGEHKHLIVLTATLSQWSIKVYMLRQMNLDKLRRELRSNAVPKEEKASTDPTAGMPLNN